MDFLTLGILPFIGAACRDLVSVRLYGLSDTIFLPTTMAVRNMARASSASGSSSSSSSADTCLFPHLTDLHIMPCNTDEPVGVYDPSVLSSLVSLLTPSPLTILRLDYLELSAQHQAIFAPLQHLVQLDVNLDSSYGQCRVRRSRQQAQRFMTSHLFTSVWSVDDVDTVYHQAYTGCSFSGSFGFDPEPRWRLKEKGGQERLVNGREAFFASLLDDNGVMMR
jgi:hypothetical protein